MDNSEIPKRTDNFSDVFNLVTSEGLFFHLFPFHDSMTVKNINDKKGRGKKYDLCCGKVIRTIDLSDVEFMSMSYSSITRWLSWRNSMKRFQRNDKYGRSHKESVTNVSRRTLDASQLTFTFLSLRFSMVWNIYGLQKADNATFTKNRLE